MCKDILVQHPKSINSKPVKLKTKGWNCVCWNCGNTTWKSGIPKDRSGNRCEKAFCDRKCYDEYRVKITLTDKSKCKNCDKPLAKAGEVKRIFCSMKCRTEYSATGTVSCVVCKIKFTPIKWSKSNVTGNTILIRAYKRKVCSKECHYEFYSTDENRKKKISKAFKGDKHPNWLGGSHRVGYRGADWVAISEKARKRDGYCCVKCGKSQDKNGRKLDVNHIIPFNQFENKKKANSLKNLESLCRSCHMKTDWEYRKNNPMQQVLDIFIKQKEKSPTILVGRL